MVFDWDVVREIAAAEVEATLAELPVELRTPARALAVTFERIPNLGLREEGVLADTLGLFVGPAFSEEESSLSPLPPQIILFLENLWEYSEGDEEIFTEEVHTTFLHELGHYLGLDEDDLFARGLD